MNSTKNLIRAGIGCIGLSLAGLLYNFFNMYNLSAKCPEDIDVQPCSAYDNWQLINRVGLIILVTGIIVLVIGFIKRQHKD